MGSALLDSDHTFMRTVVLWGFYNLCVLTERAPNLLGQINVNWRTNKVGILIKLEVFVVVWLLIK